MKKLLLIIFLLFCSPLYAGEYLGEFQIGDTVYFSAAFNDTTGTQYENTASVTGRLYRGGTYVAAPAWAELDDANLVGVWQTSQDTTGYTAGQYTMVVWGTIDSSKVPQKTLIFNLYAATGKQVDIESLGGVVQSLTDLKDFADAGYDPTNNVITGIADGALSAAKFGADFITSAKIADNAIATEHIAANAIGASEIAADAIGSSEFAATAAIEIIDNFETQSQADPTGFHVNVYEMGGIAQTANDNGADINAILVDTTVIGVLGAGLTAIPWNSNWDTEVESEVDDALVVQELDHLVHVADSDDPADNSIVAKLVSNNATADWSTFVNTTDALQAIRDRGDAAWITGGGGSISDILNIQALIPNDIDLANTVTVRLSLGLTNMLDDLPSTAEVAVGTITIDRKVIGGTSWTNIVNAAACSEVAGLIYYDEIFDSGTGYAEGDSIRITFKSQKITVAANDYEITGTDGWIFQTSIRQTMVGTDSAALATTALSNVNWTNTKADYLDEAISGIDDNPWDAGTRTLTANTNFNDPTAAAIVNEWESQSQADPTGFHINVLEINGTTQTANDNGADINAILVDTEAQDTSSELRTLLTGSDTAISVLVVGDNIGVNFSNISGTLDAGEIGANAFTAEKFATGCLTSDEFAANAIDEILDEEVDNDGTAISLRGAMKLMLSVLTGKSGGGGTATATFRDLGDTKDRISATVTSVGNRTAVTRDAQ